MLPIVLVLLVATSALAAPSVSVSLANINEIAPRPDNGRPVNGGMIDQVFELKDGAEASIYTTYVQQVINDMANQPDGLSQAIAVAQSLAVLGEMAPGVPGDACAAASAINAYANGGSPRGYLNTLASYIDNIAQLATNPASLRYSSGSRGGCSGGGRSYNFEAAWDRILDRASPYNIGLYNEEYCATKRLYSAADVRSNNIAAGVTAAASVADYVQNAIGPITNFLRVAVSGGNPSAAAAVAKQALLG